MSARFWIRWTRLSGESGWCLRDNEDTIEGRASYPQVEALARAGRLQGSSPDGSKYDVVPTGGVS